MSQISTRPCYVYIYVYIPARIVRIAPRCHGLRDSLRARVCGCDFNLARLTLKVEATAGTSGKGREKREEKTKEKNEIWRRIAYRDTYFPEKNPRRYCFLRNIIFARMSDCDKMLKQLLQQIEGARDETCICAMHQVLRDGGIFARCVGFSVASELRDAAVAVSRFGA